MMSNETARALVIAVREVAAANPDKIYIKETDAHGYSSCLYTHKDGSPGCLIGQGLAKLGIKVSHDETRNTEGIDSSNGCWPELEADDEDQAYEEVSVLVNWLSAAQGHQDVGYPWSEAVAEADAHYPSVQAYV